MTSSNYGFSKQQQATGGGGAHPKQDLSETVITPFLVLFSHSQNVDSSPLPVPGSVLSCIV